MLFFSLMLLVIGCDGGTTDTTESTLCADLVENDGGCMNDDNLLECQEKVEECGDDVAILESCPLQFACE